MRIPGKADNLAPAAVTMEDDLDVVAVGIQGEGGVVVAAVGTFTRRAVVAPAGGDRCGMGRVDLLGTLGRQREVGSPDRRFRELESKRLVVLAAVAATEAERGRLVPDQRPAQWAERGCVEGARRVEVGDGELDVVDRHRGLMLPTW